LIPSTALLLYRLSVLNHIYGIAKYKVAVEKKLPIIATGMARETRYRADIFGKVKW
jgi:hypothetical protein